MAGLRKFGSAEEKFGPLARGHGARKCALQTLPGGEGVSICLPGRAGSA